MNILYAITLTAIIVFVEFILISAILIKDAEAVPGWVKTVALFGVFLVTMLIVVTAIAYIWTTLVPL